MIRSVVFDLGGVLIDWNPRYLYRKLFAGDDAAMEHFLTHVCNNAWNLAQDGGRTWADAIEVLSAEHPQHRPLISAYRERWDEMLNGPIHGTVDVLAELKDKGVPIYALTNWSAETFPIAKDALRVPGMVPGHPGFRRREADQAGPAHLRAAAVPQRAGGGRVRLHRRRAAQRRRRRGRGHVGAAFPVAGEAPRRSPALRLLRRHLVPAA